MDQFEKVEKLAQKANVSFEEAKAALELNNWDMLDAMITLENRGKKGTAQEQAAFKTGFDNQPNYKKVDTAEAKTYKKPKDDFGEKIKKLLIKSHENHFIVRRKGNPIINLPIWAMILIFCCFWKFSLVMFVIGLFCGCSFSFEGPSNMKSANETMSGIQKTANEVKDSFTNAYNETKSDIEKKRAQEQAQKAEFELQAKARKLEEEAAEKARKAEEERKAEAASKAEAARKAEEEARAAVEEAQRMAAEFEKEDFSPIVDKEVNESAADTFRADSERDAQAAAEFTANMQSIGNVFNDNSVTTADGTITLEL